MENYSRNPIIIAGHSHTVALSVPFCRPGAPSLMPLQNPNFVAVVGENDSDSYWDFLVQSSPGRQVGLYWLGNQHTARFLLAHDPDVDFLLPGADFGAPDKGAVIVPTTLVADTFKPGMEALRTLLKRLRDVGAEPFLIGTPPPRGDEDYLKALFDARDKWFVSFSNLVGVDIDSVKLVPVRRRYKAWVLLQRMMQEIADEHSILFIPSPEQAADQNGYLKPEFAVDTTHGNSEYGKIVLDNVLEALSEQHLFCKQPQKKAAPAEQNHPYKALSDRHFWSRAFSNAAPSNLLDAKDLPLVKTGQKVVSAGSCFAATVVSYLDRAGFYFRTEQRPPMFKSRPEHFGYSVFSAAYGNIYTARQMLQLLRRSRGTFRPIEDRWETTEAIIDPFRPGLKYYAKSHEEFDLLTRQHLEACMRAFTEADVFIFTLGLTEAWVSKHDGAVFPACPGTVNGSFDPAKHEFVNFSCCDVISDLSQFVDELREINPGVRIILTVSPVPIAATATDNHVLSASTHSKSVLRVAAETVCANRPNVTYFPSYEIITAPHARAHFFQDDKRNVTPDAVDAVMKIFLSCCEPSQTAADNASEVKAAAIQKLSERFAEAECEEVMADSRVSGSLTAP